ncbi:xylitol dehydrogenase [Lentinula raphanica]|uniref:Xylitol dehydrogenase n=1 Tax=Lentinula raphanica TaxID=153919 RepID=A0AA38P2Z7_9AGAR|nr:xylitol dehydrogenase [Lentinula raphanica]
MSNNPSFVLRVIENVVYGERPVPDSSKPKIKASTVSDTEVIVAIKTGIVPSSSTLGFVAQILNILQLCPDIMFATTPPYDGTLARYYCILGDLTYPLPEHLTLEDSATSMVIPMEPLSLGVHSAMSNLGNFKFGQSIAVFGFRPVGLLCMPAVAEALGPRRIFCCRCRPFASGIRQDLCWRDTLPLSPSGDESKLRYSGTLVQVCIFGLKHGVHYPNCITQVGMGNPNIQIDLSPLMTKEVAYKGSFRYTVHEYHTVSLVAQGKIDLKPLVTHRYNFDEAIAAFKATRSGKSEDGKDVIKAIISGPEECSMTIASKRGSVYLMWTS